MRAFHPSKPARGPSAHPSRLAPGTFPFRLLFGELTLSNSPNSLWVIPPEFLQPLIGTSLFHLSALFSILAHSNVGMSAETISLACRCMLLACRRIPFTCRRKPFFVCRRTFFACQRKSSFDISCGRVVVCGCQRLWSVRFGNCAILDT